VALVTPKPLRAGHPQVALEPCFFAAPGLKKLTQRPMNHSGGLDGVLTTPNSYNNTSIPESFVSPLSVKIIVIGAVPCQASVFSNC
jgi:hypothetical protein